MKPINVLYLVRTWAIGGSHTILFLLLKHLPPDRYNLICVPYDTPSQSDDVFVRALEREGFPVPQDRIPWRNRAGWRDARDTIARLVAKYDAALIHTHDPQSNVLVGVGRKRWQCACVGSAYGWWTRLFPLRSHAYQWVERNWALPGMERVITVSQNMKGKVLRGRTPEDRIRVINTGLEPKAVQAGDGAATRKKLGIPEDACVVGTVSRIYIEKGLSFLIDAADSLAETCPHLHLLIVGEGPLREELQARAAGTAMADRIHFTGFYADLPGALAAMDVLAQPSILDEGFPTAVLEAQLAGLPVVASDVGGTHETMDVGKTGLLVPPRNMSALAEALQELANNPERRAAMAAAGPPWIEGSFTLDQMIERVCATYEEALEAYRAGS